MLSPCAPKDHSRNRQPEADEGEAYVAMYLAQS
jgi:hypothetical protein